MSGALTAPLSAIASGIGFVVPVQMPEDAALLGDHPALLALAQAALARRRAAYPDLVSAGKMPEADAKADVAAWELLAAEWDWICTGNGEAPPRWTLHDRIDAVDLAIERTSAALAAAPMRGGERESLRHLRDLYRAMHHHLALAGFGGQRCHHFARINHALRARAIGQVLCATCERRSDDPATIGCTRTDCGLIKPERKAA